VDHRSFRDQLVFSIGFAVSQSRHLLRRLLKEHAPDDARQQLAQRVVRHLEESGFELDEDRQGAQEEARCGATPDARRIGGCGSSRPSSAFAVMSRLAAALIAVRVVAASSSRSALRSALVQYSKSDVPPT
jgi:hypothetical protein